MKSHCDNERYIPIAKKRKPRKWYLTFKQYHSIYGRGYRTVSSHIKKIFEASKFWFYRRMIGIPWTELVSHGEVLEKMEIKNDTYI